MLTFHGALEYCRNRSFVHNIYTQMVSPLDALHGYAIVRDIWNSVWLHNLYIQNFFPPYDAKCVYPNF